MDGLFDNQEYSTIAISAAWIDYSDTFWRDPLLIDPKQWLCKLELIEGSVIEISSDPLGRLIAIVGRTGFDKFNLKDIIG